MRAARSSKVKGEEQRGRQGRKGEWENGEEEEAQRARGSSSEVLVLPWRAQTLSLSTASPPFRFQSDLLFDAGQGKAMPRSHQAP